MPHIPKAERYTLGGKIDALLLETIESALIASRLSKEQKLPFIQKSVSKLDLLKFFLQISWEVKALDTRKYAMLSEKLDEIGRMLGGWLKQTMSRNQSAEHHP